MSDARRCRASTIISVTSDHRTLGGQALGLALRQLRAIAAGGPVQAELTHQGLVPVRS